MPPQIPPSSEAVEQYLAFLQMRAPSRGPLLGPDEQVYGTRSSSLRNKSGSQRIRNRDRLVHVLDALASICVNKPSKHVVAVTASTSSKKVILYVAENGTVQPAVVRHLDAVWHLLQDISRLRNGDESAPYAQEAAVPVRGLEREAKATKLMGLLYTFSWKKLWQRVHSHHIDCQDYLSFIREEAASPSQRTFLAHLEMLVKVLIRSIHEYRKPPAPADVFAGRVGQELHEQWGYTWIHYVQDDKEGSVLKTWDSRFRQVRTAKRGPEEKVFSLAKYLREIFALDTHFRTLLLAALTNGLETLFQPDVLFEIVEIPHLQGTIDIAFYHADLGDLLRSACYDPVRDEKVLTYCQDACARSKECFKDAARDDRLHFDDIPVHCECSMLLYHHLHPDLSVYGYIAISKPCCYACRCFFDAYNAVIAPLHGRRPFYIKSGRKKGFFPWLCPSLQMHSLDNGPSDFDKAVWEHMLDANLKDDLWKSVLPELKSDYAWDGMFDWSNVHDESAVRVDLMANQGLRDAVAAWEALKASCEN